MKVCRFCGGNENIVHLVKSATAYYKGVKKTYYSCTLCNTKRQRKYRSTKSGAEAVIRSIKNYESTHPERRKAWSAALKIQLLPCEVCGDPKSHRHHPNPKERLKVQFLCPFHHKQLHSMV